MCIRDSKGAVLTTEAAGDWTDVLGQRVGAHVAGEPRVQAAVVGQCVPTGHSRGVEQGTHAARARTDLQRQAVLAQTLRKP